MSLYWLSMGVAGSYPRNGQWAPVSVNPRREAFCYVCGVCFACNPLVTGQSPMLVNI